MGISDPDPDVHKSKLTAARCKIAAGAEVRCIAVILAAICCLALPGLSLLMPPGAAADDPLFAAMESDLSDKDKTPDRAICQLFYGKSFDRWIKAYCEGRSGDAATEWGQVLKTKGRREPL